MRNPSRGRAAYLVAFLTLLCAGGLKGQRPAFGPLTSEEGSPLQRIALVATTEGPDVTPRGGFRADLWLGLSNIFEQDSSATHVVFIDMERLLTAATVRWGVAEGVELGGRLTFESTGTGILDSFVHEYHDLFGFGQANRDRFPQDAYAQRLSDGGSRVYLDVGSRTLGLEDVRAFAKWRAFSSDDGRSALSIRTEVRVPARSGATSARRTDLALAGLGRLGMGAWYLHGMVSAATARAAPDLRPIVRGGSVFAALGVERSLGASVAAVLQYQVSTPLLDGFDHRELDWPASNLVFGLAGGWGDAWSWDASFQEDIPSDTPAIDFTVGLRVSRSWR